MRQVWLLQLLLGLKLRLRVQPLLLVPLQDIVAVATNLQMTALMCMLCVLCLLCVFCCLLSNSDLGLGWGEEADFLRHEEEEEREEQRRIDAGAEA